MAETEVDVVVIGGGVSGLAAAAAVRKAGGRAVVLEATSRLGGRVWSYRTPEWGPDVAVDLGGAWVHGATKKNPLSRLTSSCKRVVTDWEPGPGATVTPSEFESAHAQKAKMEKARRLALKTKEWKRAKASGADVGLWEGLQSLPDAKFSELSSREACLLRFAWVLDGEADYAGWLEEYSIEGGQVMRPLSFLSYDDDEEFPGDDELLPGGMDQLLKHPDLGPDHPDNRLNSCVTSVEVTNEFGAGVLVHTADGRVHRGSACICTLPLGVLQSPKCPEFVPPLPAWKLEAISKLQMGVFNKTVLEFDAPWWPEKDAVFYNVDDNGAFRYFVNYCPILGRPVIVGFSNGKLGREIEALSDDEVAARCVSELRQSIKSMPDAPDPPNPLRIVVTRWGSNEHTFGSYAHIPSGASWSTCRAMGRGVGPLHWAGEATSEYIGTIHGAFLSGIKAAKECIKSYVLEGRR